jgi:TRAP transporter TAXI family solute receptor
MKKLKELYPYYAENTIPKGTYGNKEDVPTASIMNLLVVRRDMDEETVYRLTKTMFENLDKIQSSHNAAKAIQLETAKESVPVPFHPGAEKNFKEAGAE